MRQNFGVKVKLENGSFGYIVRRLNAESYEIVLTDTDELVILSPKEFQELPNERTED